MSYFRFYLSILRMFFQQDTLLPISSTHAPPDSAISAGRLYDALGRRKYVNEEETLRFLRAAHALPAYARLFCELIAYTGCRISEALNLCGFHVHDGEVVFRTLKRRQTVFRVVPVPTWLTSALHGLASAKDRAHRLWRVSRNAAYEWIMRAMRIACIGQEGDIHACPKGLRHGFGVRYAMLGTPIGTIQKWMGHASVKTTMIYLNVVGQEERRMAERGWPCAAS